MDHIIDYIIILYIIYYIWWWSTTYSICEHDEQLYEQRFHKVAFSITFVLANGSACTISSMDRLSLQHTITTNSFSYIKLESKKSLHPVIYKKLCLLWESNPRSGVESLKLWPLNHGASTKNRINKRIIYRQIKENRFIRYKWRL